MAASPRPPGAMRTPGFAKATLQRHLRETAELQHFRLAPRIARKATQRIEDPARHPPGLRLGPVPASPCSGWFGFASAVEAFVAATAQRPDGCRL